MKHVRFSFISKTFLLNALNEPLLKDTTIMETIINYLLSIDPICNYDNINGLVNNKRARISKSIINKSNVSSLVPTFLLNLNYIIQNILYCLGYYSNR